MREKGEDRPEKGREGHCKEEKTTILRIVI
jgi:hypothetical protein